MRSDNEWVHNEPYLVVRSPFIPDVAALSSDDDPVLEIDAIHVFTGLDPLDDSDSEADDGSRHSYGGMKLANSPFTILLTLILDIRLQVLNNLLLLTS